MSGQAYIQPFASEIAKARRLGFQGLVAHDDHERTVKVRLVPMDDRARHALMRASEGDGIVAEGIEAAATYSVLNDSLMEVIRAVFETALERAAEVVA